MFVKKRLMPLSYVGYPDRIMLMYALMSMEVGEKMSQEELLDKLVKQMEQANDTLDEIRDYLASISTGSNELSTIKTDVEHIRENVASIELKLSLSQ